MENFENKNAEEQTPEEQNSQKLKNLVDRLQTVSVKKSGMEIASQTLASWGSLPLIKLIRDGDFKGFGRTNWKSENNNQNNEDVYVKASKNGIIVETRTKNGLLRKSRLSISFKGEKIIMKTQNGLGSDPKTTTVSATDLSDNGILSALEKHVTNAEKEKADRDRVILDRKNIRRKKNLERAKDMVEIEQNNADDILQQLDA